MLILMSYFTSVYTCMLHQSIYSFTVVNHFLPAHLCVCKHMCTCVCSAGMCVYASCICDVYVCTMTIYACVYMTVCVCACVHSQKAVFFSILKLIFVAAYMDDQFLCRELER